MPKRTQQNLTPAHKTLHPGSSTEDAKAVGGKGDFGVPERDVAARTYTSANTKRSDPGAAVTHSGEDGSRTSGVGGNASGVGSSSGGDLDTDIIGIGTGRGIAASGRVHEPAGPDDATGTSADFDSGPPAVGSLPPGGTAKIRGTVVQLPDDDAAGPHGADAAASAFPGDDSSAGEVSGDEASGRNDAGG